MRGLISSLGVLALVGLGCTPGFDERQSQVVGIQMLAVRADPAEARPGQILVSARVHAASRELIVVERVGELELRGFSRPVPAYNVVALDAARAPS